MCHCKSEESGAKLREETSDLDGRGSGGSLNHQAM